MLRTFSITDVGKKRKLNQDYVYVSERPIGSLDNLFVVADGMGGHNAGDLASQISVTTIVDTIIKSKETERICILEDAVKEANKLISDMAKDKEELQGMGTTVVVATFDGKQLFVANVGDSRLYICNQTITQITRDHSLVEEMVRLGGIDKKKARFHPDKNVITRAVGVEETIQIDFFDTELRKGDVVLMCSDGLTNMLDDQEIQVIMSINGDLEHKAKALVEAANEKGGKDNIAVVLVDPYGSNFDETGGAK